MLFTTSTLLFTCPGRAPACGGIECWLAAAGGRGESSSLAVVWLCDSGSHTGPGLPSSSALHGRRVRADAAHAGATADDLGAAPAAAADLGVVCPLAGLPQPVVAALAHAVGLPDWGAPEGPPCAGALAAQVPRLMPARPRTHLAVC